MALHDASNPENPPVDVRYWRQRKSLGRDRSRTQAEFIVESFAQTRPSPRNRRRSQSIVKQRWTDNDFQYFYRSSTLLTQPQDAPAVYSVLGIPPPPSVAPSTRGGLHHVTLPDGTGVHTSLDRLDEEMGAGVATPDHVVHLCGNGVICPATEPFPTSSPLSPPRNRDAETDGRRARIVAVDTGIAGGVVSRHRGLRGIRGDREQADLGHYRGHGVFVAGVLRAMAPAAQVHVEALLFERGAVLESDLAPAMHRALDLAPDIVSMSAGTRTRKGLPLKSLQAVWDDRLRHLKGTVLVAAAGNDGDWQPFWPAAFPWAVSVGALNSTLERRAGYSNYGSWVDVYAQGSRIISAYPNGKYTYVEEPMKGQPDAEFTNGLASWCGTSFSTPIVAGLIAGRMTWSGESARDAADALLKLARQNAKLGVGAVLEPGMARIRT